MHRNIFGRKADPILWNMVLCLCNILLIICDGVLFPLSLLGVSSELVFCFFEDHDYISQSIIWCHFYKVSTSGQDQSQGPGYIAVSNLESHAGA